MWRPNQLRRWRCCQREINNRCEPFGGHDGIVVVPVVVPGLLGLPEEDGGHKDDPEEQKKKHRDAAAPKARLVHDSNTTPAHVRVNRDAVQVVKAE